MDFDSKKALLKQLEGYKFLVSQREEELRKCELEKVEAQRVAKVVNIALSKIKNSISNNVKCETELNESLKPIKEFVLNNQIEHDLMHNLDFCLNIISKSIFDNSGKNNFRFIESVSEIQKDLIISEMETKLNNQIEKSNILESKVFSLEKKIFSMKSFNEEEKIGDGSSAKRPRTETDQINHTTEADGGDQALKTKFKVLSAEFEELKKISDNRLMELDLLNADKRKLIEELESKKDQIRKIPQEFLKDSSSIRQTYDDLRRYKADLNDAVLTIKNLEKEIEDSNYRNKKLISQLERDVREKYTKLDDFVRTTDAEISRLRKDRDTMRQMYEQSNQLVSSSQKQLLSYQKNINCSEVAINQLTGTVERLKTRVANMSNPDSNSTEVNKSLETSDEQLYIEELENLGKAFEQLQNENTNLVKKIAEKDDQISKLMGDKLKAEFSFSQIQKEAESSLERAQKIEEIAKHRVSEIESREETLRRQVASMDKGLSDQLISLNNYKHRLSEAVAENSYLRNKLDQHIAEITELKNLIPAPGHKDQLMHEKRRLTEELSIANKKLEAYASSGTGLVHELEEELSNYKKLMKCNSCHIRDKNAVILKCMHCFCKNCLDIRLETRQRKCPNCGDAFGANDVKQIFL